MIPVDSGQYAIPVFYVPVSTEIYIMSGFFFFMFRSMLNNMAPEFP